MTEPCKFLYLDSYQKKFMWTHKEGDLAPHPVVGLVLQVGDAEKFPQALGCESLDPFLSFFFFFFSFFFSIFLIGSFIATEENGGDKRLVRLELGRGQLNASNLHLPAPFPKFRRSRPTGRNWRETETDRQTDRETNREVAALVSVVTAMLHADTPKLVLCTGTGVKAPATSE